MNRIRLENLTMEHIMIFMNVAKTLNMSKSAREMFLGQPTVSKRIAETESIVGFELFDRKSNRLTLTAAGRYLYEQLEEIYGKLEKVIYDSAAIDQGYQSHFNICVDTLYGADILYKTFEEFRKRFPMVNLNIETDVYNVKEKVYNEEKDLAFTDYEPGGTYDLGLEYEFLKDFQICVIVHRDHPLARKERITVEDLADVRLIVSKDEVIDSYSRRLNNIFAQYDLKPIIAQEVYSSRLEYQALFNKGVVLVVPETMNENLPESIATIKNYLKIYPINYVDRSGICWKKGKKTALIEEFIRIFKENMKEKKPQRTTF